MKTIQKTARFFSCFCCHQQVVICSHCDRGNLYCGAMCSQRTRILNHRIANQTYQQSLKGRLKHAQRQQRYRAQKITTSKKVTDRGSPDLPAHDVLPDRPDEGRTQLVDTTRCHFCGDVVSHFLRNGFLRHHRNDVSSSWPLGP
jgi:hypothetical protein